MRMESANQNRNGQGRIPEARYAYYRRCQVLRRNGEQCKAPAEKGAHICYSHAAQQDMARRRAEGRRALLAQPGVGFGDFRQIQRAIAAVAQALIDGRIDSKTAGRLTVEIQMAAKLQWAEEIHRKGREEGPGSPQICAEERRSEKIEHRGRIPELTAEAPAPAHEARAGEPGRRHGEKQEISEERPVHLTIGISTASRDTSGERKAENQEHLNHRGHRDAQRPVRLRCSASAARPRLGCGEGWSAVGRGRAGGGEAARAGSGARWMASRRLRRYGLVSRE